VVLGRGKVSKDMGGGKKGELASQYKYRARYSESKELTPEWWERAQRNKGGLGEK